MLGYNTSVRKYTYIFVEPDLTCDCFSGAGREDYSLYHYF